MVESPSLRQKTPSFDSIPYPQPLVAIFGWNQTLSLYFWLKICSKLEIPSRSGSQGNFLNAVVTL
jgi:hypothetical protein